MQIEDLLFDNLEFIVAGVGGIGAFLFFKNRKRFSGRRCNLNRFIIKYKKQTELLNKQTKSSNTLFGK